MPFPFENLTVYKLAVEWVECAAIHSQALKHSNLSPLADQLVRAATSIPLNIAEGNGRWHKPDKRQFFWIARGSVFECVAILQVAHRKQILTEEAYRLGYDMLQSLAKMLTKLVQSVESLRSVPPAIASGGNDVLP